MIKKGKEKESFPFSWVRFFMKKSEAISNWLLISIVYSTNIQNPASARLSLIRWSVFNACLSTEPRDGINATNQLSLLDRIP